MMKSEPKAFASLSSGLLARKGAARPAMRPQGFGQMGSGLDDLGWNDMGFEPPKPALAVAGEDSAPALRVNPASGLTPASPVHAVQEEIVHRLAADPCEDEPDETAEPVPVDALPLEQMLAQPAVAPEVETPRIVALPKPAAPKVRRPRAAAGSAKGKAAFTLRLDTERHLKLRLACALSSTSAQQLVTRALDELLGSMPELDAMAKSASAKE